VLVGGSPPRAPPAPPRTTWWLHRRRGRTRPGGLGPPYPTAHPSPITAQHPCLSVASPVLTGVGRVSSGRHGGRWRSCRGRRHQAPLKMNGGPPRPINLRPARAPRPPPVCSAAACTCDPPLTQQTRDRQRGVRATRRGAIPTAGCGGRGGRGPPQYQPQALGPGRRGGLARMRSAQALSLAWFGWCLRSWLGPAASGPSLRLRVCGG
jgi:hypothetical protein